MKPSIDTKGEKIHSKLCTKHPELRGLRYLSNHNCVGCAKDSVSRSAQHRIAKHEVLLREWAEMFKGGGYDGAVITLREKTLNLIGAAP